MNIKSRIEKLEVSKGLRRKLDIGEELQKAYNRLNAMSPDERAKHDEDFLRNDASDPEWYRAAIARLRQCKGNGIS